jgi:sortase family protein
VARHGDRAAHLGRLGPSAVWFAAWCVGLVCLTLAGGSTAVTDPTGGSAPPGPRPAAWAPVIPVGLSIPAIGLVVSGLAPLGLTGAGRLAAPAEYSQVGWYTGAPTPGSPGAGVIAAHVDSVAGPAPFFRLGELSPGDPVTVRRSDGRSVTFVVDSVRQYPKTDFPTATVYGPVPGVALRLITCGGSFDAGVRSYRDNIVVYASVHDNGVPGQTGPESSYFRVKYR